MTSKLTAYLHRLKENNDAFKFQYTVNRKNQVCDYSETVGPTIETLLAMNLKMVEALEDIKAHSVSPFTETKWNAYALEVSRDTLCEIEGMIKDE